MREVGYVRYSPIENKFRIYINPEFQRNGAIRRRSVKTAGNSPHPVDIHVGDRVRLRRRNIGLNQHELAETVGVGIQQVQRYERGKTRIAASMLFELSEALDVPISYFFDDMPADIPQKRVSRLQDRGLSENAAIAELFDTLEAIENVDLRRSFINLLRMMAKNAEMSRSIASALTSHGRSRTAADRTAEQRTHSTLAAKRGP